MGPVRYPRFPYVSPQPWAHWRRGEIGEMFQDAVSGFWQYRVFAVETPYGLVDGRNGNVLDLDFAEHELVPDVTTLPPRK